MPAKNSTSAKAELFDALRLGLVPVGVAILFGVLLIPRESVPDGIPVPVADARGLARAAAEDRALAERARREPLPGPVRALGSAIRQFHAAEVGDDPRAISTARRGLDDALMAVMPGDDDVLLRLRAIELEGFLDQVRVFESTGAQSGELLALAGGFVRAMQSEGWGHDRELMGGPGALSALFKHMWNGLLGLEDRPALSPSLDEERSLYALYLAHPHAPPKVEQVIGARRRGARDAHDCRAVAEAEEKAVARWALEKLGRLAAIDPSYPVGYARGIADFHAGDYAASASSFREWLSTHPDGPYALRARFFLRSAAAHARLD